MLEIHLIAFLLHNNHVGHKSKHLYIGNKHIYEYITQYSTN
jgi:hypothetical protein